MRPIQNNVAYAANQKPNNNSTFIRYDDSFKFGLRKQYDDRNSPSKNREMSNLSMFQNNNNLTQTVSDMNRSFNLTFTNAATKNDSYSNFFSSSLLLNENVVIPKSPDQMHTIVLDKPYIRELDLSIDFIKEREKKLKKQSDKARIKRNIHIPNKTISRIKPAIPLINITKLDDKTRRNNSVHHTINTTAMLDTTGMTSGRATYEQNTSVDYVQHKKAKAELAQIFGYSPQRTHKKFDFQNSYYHDPAQFKMTLEPIDHKVRRKSQISLLSSTQIMKETFKSSLYDKLEELVKSPEVKKERIEIPSPKKISSELAMIIEMKKLKTYEKSPAKKNDMDSRSRISPSPERNKKENIKNESESNSPQRKQAENSQSESRRFMQTEKNWRFNLLPSVKQLELNVGTGYNGVSVPQPRHLKKIDRQAFLL